jgi:hypothetical protein
MTPKQKKRRETLYLLLESLEIDKVEVTFDGSGDEGQFEEPLLLRQGKPIELPPDVLETTRPNLEAISHREYGPSLPPEGLEVTTPCSLNEAITSLACEILDRKHAGWENNEGGYGCVILDPKNKKAHLEFHERHITFGSSYEDLD